ncbi:DUF4174 domain-containing protein [Flammeovirgaceae bacterium SG7u.111]|nr:DUF4174 domain-containing protein [Flammeovirgaceae bacterium SG7u.132]WPO34349.1 DUF4174 domain-containing protein [Flammeovirgaceae bacterium SG7u.111]
MLYFIHILFFSLIATIKFQEVRQVPLPLSQYQWENRLLLVFAKEKSDEQLLALKKQLKAEADELKGRDILVFYFFQDNSGEFEGKKLDEKEVEKLWKSYLPSREVTTLLLIGKDGGEKYRKTKGFDLNEIFSLIDGMPMRRQEMRQRGKN